MRGAIEAEFCGRTFLDAMGRVHRFRGATGLKLVDVRFWGTVDTGEDKLECHGTVFRRG